ncbi:pentapeptide repeat-containing protein, partial [Albidovulum sp.]
GALIAALLGAPFVIWATVIRHRTVEFQKEGHITDRIHKAVEMLGADKVERRDGQERTVPNIEVRIGALLSLERIAQDSTAYDRGRDHVRVMEILCAYVRQNAPATEARDFPLPDWEPLAEDADAAARAEHAAWRDVRFGDPSFFGDSEKPGNARAWARSLPKPRADIALALTVIGRRTAPQRLVEAAWPDPPGPETAWPFDTPCPALPDGPGEAPRTAEELEAFRKKLEAWKQRLTDYRGYRPDLRRTNLQCADLSGLVLSGARLEGARLEGVLIRGARLEGTDLRNAPLQAADLEGTRLEGANLSGARLEGANLSAAWLWGARLSHTRMEGANLSGAWLEGAMLEQARLERAWLYRARLEGANIQNAHLEAADLMEARLDRAMLTGARMYGATLYDARMEGARLTAARLWEANLSDSRMGGADLSEARMEGAMLTFAQLEGALFWRARLNAGTNLWAASLAGAAAKEADWRAARLTQAQIDVIFADATLLIPDGLTRPAHWPKRALTSEEFGPEWRRWQADPEHYQPKP